MISAAVLDALLAAGATAEQIVAAVKADAQEQEQRQSERRAKDAARQRKSREGRGMSRSVTVTPRDETDTPPNDIYSNPPEDKPSPSGDGQKSLDCEKVVEAWNEMAGRVSLKSIRKLNPTRKRGLKARLAEYGLETMLEAIRKVEASDFCAGRTDRWSGATFDFLVSDSRFLRLIEGNYDNKTAAVVKFEGPKRPTNPVAYAKWCEQQADNYERIGQDHEAERLRKQAAQLRGTGPPKAIGDLIPKHLQHHGQA
jgi:hypothetical protein